MENLNSDIPTESFVAVIEQDIYDYYEKRDVPAFFVGFYLQTISHLGSLFGYMSFVQSFNDENLRKAAEDLADRTLVDVFMGAGNASSNLS